MVMTIMTMVLKCFMVMIISMKFCKIRLNFDGKGLSMVSMATGDLAKTPHLCMCALVFEYVSVYE